MIIKKIFHLIGELNRRKAGTHASSIAFFFFLSLIPLLILYTSLVPRTGISVEEIVSFFMEFVPSGLDLLVDTIVKEAYSQSGMALSVSLFFLVLTASQWTTAIIYGLNAVYEEKESRGLAKMIGISILYTAILMLFISAVIYLIFGGRILKTIQHQIPSLRLSGYTATFVNFLVMLVVGTLFFETVYTFVPAGKRKFLEQFPGAFLEASGLFIFSIAFRIYIDYFNRFTKFYGSLAAIALFLFWLYCIFYLQLAGAFINQHFMDLVPENLYRYFLKEKKEVLVLTLLFLAGLLAYLSNCFFCWRYSHSDDIFRIQMICKCITQVCCLTAGGVSTFRLHGFIPRKYAAALLILAAVDFLFMRVEFFNSPLLFLVVLFFFYLVSLVIWANMIWGKWKEQPSQNEHPGT